MKLSMRKGLLSIIFIVVVIAGLFAASQFAYSQLKSPELDTQTQPSEILDEKEMEKLRDPVNPEGKVCRAFSEYLESASEVDTSGTPEEMYERIEVLQEPVKTELETVEDSEWKVPFESYFSRHKDYMFKSLAGDSSQTENMRQILEDIAVSCSTDKATESEPKPDIP